MKLHILCANINLNLPLLNITRGSEMPQKAGCAGNIDGQTNRQKMNK